MSQRVLCITLVTAMCSTLQAGSSRTATIVSVRKEVRTQTQEFFHNTMLDSLRTPVTTVVYQFSIRSGKNLYSSEYVVPNNEKDLPKQWHSQVLIRVEGHRLYIERGDGTELPTQIVAHSVIRPTSASSK